MQEFVRSTRTSLAIISSALIQGEHSAWIREAKKIRENSAALGLIRIADVCAQLEKVTDLEHFWAAEIVFENLAREFANLAEVTPPAWVTSKGKR